MKLSVAIVLAGISSVVGVSASSIPVKSRMGLKLMNNARRLEQGEDQDKDQGEDRGDDNQGQGYNDYDNTWMGDFSLKFLGCHHIAQWNSNAENQNQVRIGSQKFVRFRLCPSENCSSSKAIGCTSGYGDYVVNMDSFIEAHFENQQELQEEKCQTQAQNCGCNGQRNLGDGENDNDCLHDCYYDAGMEYCIEGEGENTLEFLQNYAVCNQYENGGANDDHRKLEDVVQYYIGPYCSDQGGDIFLGMFTEDSCTSFADDYRGQTTFENLTGQSLPYSSEPLVDGECRSCLKAGYYQDQEGSVREVCEEVYQTAGKCEDMLGDVLENPNNNACGWIHGINFLPITSKGVIHAHYHGTLKAAIAIAFFAVTFVTLAFYVCYLRQRVELMAESDVTTEKEKQFKYDLGKSYEKKKRRSSFGWISRIFKRKKRKSESLL